MQSYRATGTGDQENYSPLVLELEVKMQKKIDDAAIM